MSPGVGGTGRAAGAEKETGKLTINVGDYGVGLVH
jgi:hypothetical protein